MDEPPPHCAVVLLAAGDGSRFRGPTHKLLAELGGRPVWEHALGHAAAAAGHRPLAVITGAQPLTAPPNVPAAVVDNPHWADGQASSLARAVRWAEQAGAEALAVGLADQPFIPAETWTRILEAGAETPIVAARYAGRPGPHPVRLDRSVWPHLERHGDRGAGPLMQRHPRWVTWLDCLGSTADIDTQEDLERWTSC